MLPPIVWLNELKQNPTQTLDVLNSDGINLSPLSDLPNTFTALNEQREAITHHSFADNGNIYLINPSSMLPPLVLNPKPSDLVLDLTAAPGSKTLIMAWLMKNQGQISAVENVKYRFHKLKANLERNGVTNTKLFLKDGTTIWKYCPERFDKILLDAPCSTEARFQTNNPKSFAFWSEKKIKEMNRKQRKLLFSAIQSLRPGGELVYSTCAFSPEENEEPIDRILHKFGNKLTVSDITIPIRNWHPAKLRWKKKEFHPDLKKAIRILPDGVFEGFFICKIRKLESTLL
ncbi:MAG: RsmB/NOP family class I SAM-dependent RNA methyltransferase [Candidatus Marinimicrobia bacterium]|nr:RsmB/NOP family class I SAM-dependent RNA methyltransferase [Candidatus Neomarinimicrobiota bacterium]